MTVFPSLVSRVCVFAFCFLWCCPVQAATLYEQGRAAETAENYQRAIELYRQAMAADPHDPASPRALAELYTGKGLHSLALPLWQEVVRREPDSSDAWMSLAQTFSYVDDNRQSARVLDQALARFSGDFAVVQSLAWMLFKTEDYDHGIALVENFISLHGTDRSLEMTLGTLYSSVYDYDNSRRHYLKSVELAPGSDADARNFRSIAWYNLSLLEKSFYRFDLAEREIKRSLAEEDRPAGTIAWGELAQGRRDFAEARRLYEKAAVDDDTPLARYDLARLLAESARLDEAEAQLDEVERHKDDTWIYNYGVTKDKLKRDLSELRADVHKARYFMLDFTPRSNLWDWAVWTWDKTREGLLWWYHDQTWKSLLIKLSDSSLVSRNSPEAWTGLAQAHRDQPELGLKYLALVRAHEVPRNPRAAASYQVEEGLLSRAPELLAKALSGLQSPWENEDRERALATLAEVRRSQGRLADMRAQLSELYRLNPGGLPIRGRGLPVRTAVFGDAADSWKRALADFAGQSGWEASSADRPGVDYALDLRTDAQGAAWTLRDADGAVVRSGTIRETTDKLRAMSELFLTIHATR
jgi:tetratricopeptide (TPR) repeat protein